MGYSDQYWNPSDLDPVYRMCKIVLCVFGIMHEVCG